MNKEQYLLNYLAEECIEVAHSASKAARFGATRIQEGSDITNVQKVVQEFADVLGVIAVISEENILEENHFDETLIDNKIKKIREMMKLSRSLGTLQD